MIKIKNFTKRFDKHSLFFDVNYSFPQKGLFAIVGPSGCGKSTLLKAMSGLDNDYDGYIIVNQINIKKLSNDERAKFRQSTIGMVFQNFNLFNLDSALNNIIIAYENYKNCIDGHLTRILEKLDIINLVNKPINTLSRGEMQRVAIARALINKPTILLCDEPTGSLDGENSKNIYGILKEISKDQLVIVATHDYEGIEKVADEIIGIDNKKLCNHKFNKKIYIDETNKINKKVDLKNRKLRFSFIVKNTIQYFKEKKIRFAFSTAILALSMLGVGLSTLLSLSLSEKIDASFSNLVDGNPLVIRRKGNQNIIDNVYSASKEQVEELKSTYNYFIKNIGVTYMVNFEDFFKDGNDFYVSCNHYNHLLTNVSVRDINDFIVYDIDSVNRFYPRQKLNLANDEIVLSLTYEEMSNICYKLQINRSFVSLGQYINKNKLQLSLHVKNNDWVYDDEQIFNIAAVYESRTNALAHTNSLWNEYVFEELMRMKSNDGSERIFPWEMYKYYYFETWDDPSSMIDVIMLNDKYSNLLLEKTSYLYHPKLCKINEICDINRAIIFSIDKNSVDFSLIESINSIGEKFENYFYASAFGYSENVVSYLNGFSKNFFIASSRESLEKTIDAHTSLSSRDLFEVNLSLDVISGNYMHALSNGLAFSSHISNLIYGRTASRLDEIVVSSSVAKTLFNDENALGKKIYVGASCEESENVDGTIYTSFATTELVIVGVNNSSHNLLYHRPNWSINFFRDRLGISMFKLLPSALIIELANNEEAYCSHLVKNLQHLYPDYEIISPLLSIHTSLESASQIITIFLFVFSFIALIISFSLLFLVIYLAVDECKGEIFILYSLGFSFREIKKIFYAKTFLLGFVAMIISMIEIFVCDVFISSYINNYFGMSSMFTLSIYPYILSFLTALLVCIGVVEIIFSMKKSAFR